MPPQVDGITGVGEGDAGGVFDLAAQLLEAELDAGRLHVSALTPAPAAPTGEPTASSSQAMPTPAPEAAAQPAAAGGQRGAARAARDPLRYDPLRSLVKEAALAQVRARSLASRAALLGPGWRVRLLTSLQHQLTLTVKPCMPSL